ncbi:molecular chaperone TorD family protein [Thioalkalicoccus limnaeus]|uniref:Molecular chaperone TorD family protein n=1 Tax=Thioalkalicoccus limnaeus TaxID=120681 RepID=A0ABV4BBY7_9GAMM
MSQTPDHLQRLAALLAQPIAESFGILEEWQPAAPWLAPARRELADLSLARWQGEHTRLFVNGFPKTPCPPFESAYREGRMGGEVRADLIDLYRRAGLTATGAPADYLGTQLECTAYLIARIQDPNGGAAGASDAEPGPPLADPPQQLLAHLWDQHLALWLPRFAADLQDAADLILYRELGGQLAALRRPGPGDA